MGQREDLLAGAKRCLAEKGYAHTTARDIVAAAGAHLGSIGYHFGSKDALLNAAVLETFDAWGDAIAAAVVAEPGGTPLDRLRRFLDGVLKMAHEQRAVLVASVQAYAQAEFAPEVRDQLAAVYAGSRRDLAALTLDVAPAEVSPEQARRYGSLTLALINGAMLQWLLDPGSAPSADDLVRAIEGFAGQGR
ncbi:MULTISPECIES: TetR/AcrR family transcriptional regulator [unclassified Micromonospora]|uniref:TetR/AcrR family transcriptional regulator n=1 Tax=unclassified Micromonospora TaxID=2617518 RepID=UPI0033265B1D